MAQCFELVSLRLIEKSENRESERFGALCLSDKGMTAFDNYLRSFETDAESVLWRMSVSIMKGEYPPPWAIIAFDRNYPIARHLNDIRGPSSDLRYSSFDFLRENSIPPDRSAVSMIVGMTRKAIEELAPRSPVLQPSWEYIQLKNAAKSWLLLADPLQDPLPTH